MTSLRERVPDVAAAVKDKQLGPLRRDAGLFPNVQGEDWLLFHEEDPNSSPVTLARLAS